MKAPEVIETTRLLLRKPVPAMRKRSFGVMPADPSVTRYLSWPTHRSVADTQAFLAWSDGGMGSLAGRIPTLYLHATGGPPLLGGTGLSFKNASRAMTGYVLAQDAWGQGFATESLQAMVELARQTGVRRLEAICHAGTPRLSARAGEMRIPAVKRSVASTLPSPIWHRKRSRMC